VEAAYSIQQQFGSYDTYRTTLGATGSLINDGSLTYRLDVEYLDKNTFRDFTFNEQVHVAPKLTWKVTNQTQIDLEYQYFNQETIIDWGIPVIGNRPAKISSSTFLGEPTDRFPYQTNSGSIMLTHSFNDDWKLQTKYYKFSNQYDDAKFSGENGPASLNEATGDLSRTFYKANHDFNSDYVTMNLDGKFSTWGVDHNVLLGGDWFDSSFTEDGTFFGSTKVASINIFNPVYGNGIGPNTELPINSFAKIDERWFGFYLQDQITFAEDWHLLTGFRFDHAEAKSSFAADRSGVKAVANELSPRVGLLYQPMQWLSLYGSYMQGFNGSVGGRTVDGNALAPNRSRQYEAGIKTEWFDGKLTSSLVFYHLSKSGIATPHTDLNLAQKGFVNQTGEARSQGIEFDISGQVAENWDVIGSYALTDTDITKDRGRDGGTRNQGNRLFSAPVHSGSFWAYHKFGEFSFPEVSVGLGAFVVGQREGDLANSFQLPGYTRLDASLKYTKPIGHTNLTVQFNVQNLLDKEYYSTARPNRVGVTPGEPITFLGSVKLDF
jgi:iron complex outermembrane receptor protein